MEDLLPMLWLLAALVVMAGCAITWGYLEGPGVFLEPFWRLAAWIVSRPAIARRIIAYAKQHPYQHITAAGNRHDVYMYRWWVFNPYERDGQYTARWRWCPISIRVHEIRRPDQDRALHDHPWNARTIILDGGYCEWREGNEYRFMRAGDTATLRFGEYHRIARVSSTGATTLFITGRKRGTWGFLVNGRKVPWREYLGLGD